MRTLVSTKDMTREEWLEWRRKGIGGSDASAIMGVNPFSTAFDVWLDKTGQYTEDLSDNEAVLWGVVLEDIVAKEFTNRTGIRLRKRNAILQHAEHDWMIANIDRLVIGEDAGAEVKTTNSFYDGKEPPEYYWVQCQHCLAVTEKSYWYLPVLAGGQKLHSYKIKRDDDYTENKLIPAEEEFWGMVQRREIPEVDGSEACSDMLKRIYSESKDESIELPEATYDLLKEYDAAALQEKEAKTKKDLIANTIKAEMGEYSRANIFDRQILWTPVESKKFDSKRFKEEQPDLYEKYTKESAYRRFQIK